MPCTPATYKVFADVGEEYVETCNLGCKHDARVVSVKRITMTHYTEEWIKALNYVSDGYGKVRHAVDAQGRHYRSEPTWDGYAAWLRDDGVRFWPRPFWSVDIYRDTAGNPLTRAGKRI